MVLKLQKQTNMTNNIQHQDTEIFIHKIRPNQIIKTLKENYLTYWNETTEKQSKLECYLALSRDYTTAEYLSTVKDTKLRRQMTRYRLSGHTLTIEIADIDSTGCPERAASVHTVPMEKWRQSNTSSPAPLTINTLEIHFIPNLKHFGLTSKC